MMKLLITVWILLFLGCAAVPEYWHVVNITGVGRDGRAYSETWAEKSLEKPENWPGEGKFRTIVPSAPGRKGL